MGSSIRRIGLVVFITSALLAFSCEKHHVGELAPEKPIEHPGEPPPPGPPPPTPDTSATPAEFFPTSTPR